MLSKRVIACLDVKDGRVVKGIKFRAHEDVGGVLELAGRYREQGADELVFYDIMASSQNRSVDVRWIEEISQFLDIPFCVAGGIRDRTRARAILNAGADKISINTPALENPDLINELAGEFGSQAVVVGVDSKRAKEGTSEDYFCFLYTGDEKKTVASKRLTLDWLVEAEQRGAGEVVLNCMDADGTGLGYDIAQLSAARARLKIPLVASGGAKTAQHFIDVFKQADVDAALAAGAFHRGELAIPKLKEDLRQNGIQVRPIWT